MNNNRKEFYLAKLSELQLHKKSLNTKNRNLYFTRILLFFVCIGFLFLFFNSSNLYIYLFFCILSFILLLFVIKINFNLNFSRKYNDYQINIIEEEINFLDFNFKHQKTGTEFFSINPYLAKDFDLFGVGSIFQLVNRCSTKSGERKFAASLCNSELNNDLIKIKQQAIKELSTKFDFTINFRTSGKFLKENGDEIDNIKYWINQNSVNIKYLKLISYIMPLTIFVIILLTIANILNSSLLMLSIFINLSIIYLNLKRTNAAHSKLNNTSAILKNYTELFRIIENESFNSVFLQNLQNNLKAENLKAGKSIQKLFKLLNVFDYRLNIIVSIILNALFLFDLQLLYRLEYWKKIHKNHISNWFDTLADFDSILNYSIFAFNYPNELNFPEISDQTFEFEAIEIGHPLIKNESRICNNIKILGKPNITIITGANMAGKSTFLRSISTNLILAMNGAPVCAKRLIFSPCNIMSSIKIQDSLVKNESYFYAELLRLKDVLRFAKENPKTIIFLDEILRGTNTKDKQSGTLGLLENLISQKAIAIIATHDLSIGELEFKYPEIVKNYCFEVELTNDQLIFDYKLKKGISNKLNASFLMKKMGIIN